MPQIKQSARGFELGDRLADLGNIYMFPPKSTETYMKKKSQNRKSELSAVVPGLSGRFLGTWSLSVSVPLLSTAGYTRSPCVVTLLKQPAMHTAAAGLESVYKPYRSAVPRTCGANKTGQEWVAAASSAKY